VGIPVLGQNANGLIDGVNRSFTTTSQYQAGTLDVWLNGQLLKPFEWTETGSNSFQLAVAPEIGDTVQVYYVTR
jgi:hypothetical protein